MQYRNFPHTDLRVSEIAFGCMSLSDDHQANARLLHQAFEAGVNFFDTADLYQKGFNEESVGRALKDRRDKVVIATKVGNQWRPDGSGWDWNPTKAYILKAVEESLRRLQTDHIDLYQLHGGTLEDPIDETIEAFETLKEKGLIRHYGISSIRPNVIREYLQRSGIRSLMMQYSLLDRRPEEMMLEQIEQAERGVIVRGGLAKGLLVDKAATDYLDYTTEQVQAVAEAVKERSGEERSPAQTALRYVLANPAVTTVAAGVRTEAQLNDVLGTSDSPPLTSSEMLALKELLGANVYTAHR
jgi:aryl-alcohol dehydrogenase-like predicted oxidoreductase